METAKTIAGAKFIFTVSPILDFILLYGIQKSKQKPIFI